tara:strand:+ start:314 stop:478 length:165 start_codon:yes stop_codon:yes gene_type:complete
MKKIKFKNKDWSEWTLWLLLVVLWNFGYPKASPLEDVIVAVILSLIFIFLKKLK